MLADRSESSRMAGGLADREREPEAIPDGGARSTARAQAVAQEDPAPIAGNSAAGALIRSRGPAFDSNMVFLVRQGQRRHVHDVVRIRAYGFSWPDDVDVVSDDVLAGFERGAPVPFPWSLEDWENPPRRSSGEMREIATSRLSGMGIEFGAGPSPMAVPLHCRVFYSDRFSHAEQRDSVFVNAPVRADQIVPPHFRSDLQHMEGLPTGAFDFLIASHVIEHIPNPIMAIERAYSRLKPGGRLVLVVPDMLKTFDRDRERTPLDHFILDHKAPSRRRDRDHFVEFYTKAFPVEEPRREKAIDDSWLAEDSIHFHTWTYESFMEMIEYVTREVAPWSEVWSQPTLPGESNWEFYVALRK
jgi:SAM-dependent methyltransferase